MKKEKIICKVDFNNGRKVKIVELKEPEPFCPEDDFAVEITTPFKGTLRFYVNKADAENMIIFAETLRRYILGRKWKPLGRKYLETRIKYLTNSSQHLIYLSRKRSEK